MVTTFRSSRVAACFSLMLFSACAAIAQPFGIDTRASNTSLLINDLPPATGSMVLQDAFPTSSGFGDMMGMLEFPDGSGRLAVLIRNGQVRVFSRSDPTTVTTFLDLTDRVTESGEFGLLGFAFDPNYASNGDVYVYYGRASQPRSVIARYNNPNPADNFINRATEDIILTLAQPATNHNGGTIAFGPDSMLYIAFGDGGGNAARTNGQDTTNLYGSMLRLDVHTAPANPQVQNYVIPPDNPFFGGTGPDQNTREEIYAYGFRNPFRWSFDPLSGALLLADVGESVEEEINAVVAGGNYGWPIMEGTTCFNTANEGNPLPSCNQSGLTLPIDVRPHGNNDSIAILGGHVFAAGTVPELYGMYIYSDFVTGNVWGLRYDGQVVTEQTLLLSTSLFLFSLAQDAAGEVYVLDNGSARILVLRPASTPPPNDFPTRLSDIPALLNAGLGMDQTGSGIIPYEPSAKLWTDGALKERFIAIPGLGQITYQPTGGWNFPDRTVLIKNFLLPLDFRDPVNTLKRVETRLLIRNGGGWHGFSYEWNDAETDAVLLPGTKLRPFTPISELGLPFEYEWLYPSRTDCFRCHTSVTNRVAGITTPQMNWDYTYPASGVTDNQLRTFDHLNLFASPLPGTPAELASAPSWSDETATTVRRAEAYVLANCSMCHQPSGPTPVDIDFRWDIALGSRNIFDVVPALEDFGLPNARRFAPGAPLDSVIFWRMFTLGVDRMPPLGTSRVDGEGLNLVSAWTTLMTTLGGPDLIWVDFAHGGGGYGTEAAPFDSLGEGANNVADGGTVRMIPGDSPETLTVSTPSTLESTGGPVRIGTP